MLTEPEAIALIRACSTRAPTGIRNRALIAVLWRSACGSPRRWSWSCATSISRPVLALEPGGAGRVYFLAFSLSGPGQLPYRKVDQTPGCYPPSVAQDAGAFGGSVRAGA